MQQQLLSGLRRTLKCSALLCLLHAGAAIAEQPRIAIIIDDLGYELAAGLRAINLPGPVAFAVLPSTPRGPALAEQANRQGKEILLHLPLQSVAYSGPAEPGSIVLDMSRGQFAKSFARSFASVPHAIGVNNHRGSLLTRHPGHMGWLMEEIRARDSLIFVDSYTTHQSVALQLAKETGVPAARRDVFLDNERSAAAIAKEFTRLKRLAINNGLAVAIGHPYPETLTLLEEQIPRLAADGIELISISKLVSLRSGAVVQLTAAQEVAP